MATDFDFAGRGVLVTGGTRGIGRGIAESFLAAGASVWVCGRSDPDSVPTAGGRSAEFCAADVRDPEQVAHLVDGMSGSLDVVINNAGGSPYAPAADASPRFHEGVIRLNLLAPLHVAQAANRRMQDQDDGGSIVNVASVSGIRPSPGTAAYGAAKAGLINLTATLAMEWAPKVRVNAVVAGMIRTELAHLHYGDEDTVRRVAATVPVGRLGDPGDVAAACMFLTSPEAGYISGAALRIDGGGERPPFHAALEDAQDEGGGPK